MKNLILLLIVLVSLNMHAQQRTCFTVEAVNKKRSIDANYDAQMRIQEDVVRKYQETGQQDPSFAARAVRTIPVVVHVVYNTAAQNVSTAAIQSYIAQLNADYSKANADFSTARSAVQSLGANANIQFCLAQQTPNGAATTGIERVSTTHTDWDVNTQTDDMKSASTGGADAWDVLHYLNIWIVHIKGSSPQTGGTAGYAYVPAAGNGLVGDPVDGLVVDFSIGKNEPGNRTWTHEIGHYLGLHHTWGDLGSNACGNVFPATDDGYSDTPDSKAPNYTCTVNSSCTGQPSYGDLIEDYMDYTNCPVMFTTMQANAMNSTLTSLRSALVTNNNKCGVIGAPTASFTAIPTSICTGQTVTFTNTSTGTNNTYAWSFQGGTPATSTAANPTVTYNTAGTYSVTLTATNTNGNNTSTQTGLIVVSGSNALPLAEGFEGATFPPTGWSLTNADASTTWARTTSASGFGTSSASGYVYNYNYNAAGQKDWLITPSYNFTGVTNGRIKWDYAYAPYTGYNDSLIVLYSNNCGVSWTTLWGKGGSTLGTTTAITTNFVPGSTQWKKDSVSLASLSGQTNVRFAFKNANQYGNNIYLDNVNIYNASAQAGSAPVANFVGTPTTVVVGNTVAFTDLSTNTPTSWSWSFTGGTPSTSTAQNPTITYNTVGVYPVTLTATNINGSNPITKTAYITVIAGSTSSSCDTLSNIYSIPNDSLRLYGAGTGIWGFLAGHNGYGDLAKAELYTNTTTAQVTGGFYYFAFARTSTPATAHITASIWNANGTGGRPGTLLATQNVLISSIITDITNQRLTYVSFASPPTVTGDFYIGFSMTYAAGDTVGLVTTAFSPAPPPNNGWELQSNNVWYSYSNDTSYTANLDNFILPVICTSTATGPTATFTATPTSVCAGSTVTFTSTSTGTPTSYSWTFAGGTPSISTAQNPTVTYNTAGPYNVSLTVSNANGNNTSTQNNYITVYAKPTLTTASTAVACFGNSTGGASVTATGATSYTYNWSGGGSASAISAKPAGTYNVTVTDNHQCSSTASVNISQPLAALTLTPNTTNASCGQNNGVASVTASGGSGGNIYHWDSGASTQSLTNVAAGTYSVTVTDANACTAATTMTVGTAVNTLTVSIQSTNASCGLSNGSALALANNVLSGISYVWNNSNVGGTITNLAPGNYSVTVTNGNGCTASATTAITNVASTMNVSFSSSPSACSQSTGSITANVTGGVASYTYSWSGGGSTQTISNLAAGSYTLTVTDNGGCSVTSVGTVSNANAPTVSVSQTAPSCFNGANGSATVSASGGSQPYNYSWSSGSSSANANNLTGGNNYVVTVRDNAQCVAVQSVTISNPAQLVVAVNATNALCGNQNGTAFVDATGGTGSYAYHWNNNFSSSSLTGLSAGNYLVTVTDANQCTSTGSAQVSNALAPTSILNPINGTCQVSAQINTTVNGGTAPFTFAWNNGASTQNIQNLNAGTYVVTITDANGCTSTNSTGVSDASSVSVTFTSQNPSSGNNDGSITVLPSGGNSPYSYAWNVGGSLQTISNLPAGTYTVTVTDNSGCVKISSITLSSPNAIAVVEDIALIKVYPNPAKDVCNIQLELGKTQAVNLRLFNNMGQEVWSAQLSEFKKGIQTVDVSHLAAGIYFVKVQLNSSVETVRFMKE